MTNKEKQSIWKQLLKKIIPEPLAMAVSIFLLHRFLAQKHSSEDMAGPNFKVV